MAIEETKTVTTHKRGSKAAKRTENTQTADVQSVKSVSSEKVSKAETTSKKAKSSGRGGGRGNRAGDASGSVRGGSRGNGSGSSKGSKSTKNVKAAKNTKNSRGSKNSSAASSSAGSRRNSRLAPQTTAPQQDDVLIAPPKYRKGSMRIVPLGGLGEIGRNMNVIEYNGHLLLIDCGVLFPEEEQPGVDLILPDFHYIKDRLDKVEALVLTHGHEDHIGGVPYLLKLRPDIPLIGSKLTLAFVEAKCKEHRINPRLVEVKGRDKLKVGPFNLEFVNVTHSIPDALAVFVQTPAGSLIDTGDIKLDQLPLDHRITDLVEFGKLGEKGVDLLMMDSTNAEVPGFVKPETTIGPALDQAFAQATRKIIVASFSSHVHRVQQVVDAAHKYGRKVVFVGRSMVRNMSIAADLGYLRLPEDTVIDLKKAHDVQDDKLVYMCTGSQGEPMAALGRIADGNHRDITINEFDTVILASSLGELLYMYNIVKPKCAMPIHGENRHLVANGMIAVKTGVDPQNVVLAEDGDVVDLYHGQAAVVGSVPCGYVYVDGDSVGELTEDELEKRRILGTEGFVSSFVVVDTETADVVAGPKIYLNAVAEDESEFDKVRHQIVEQLQDAMMAGTHDTYKLQQIMRRTLGSWVARQLHRKPMIVPVVADIAQDVDEAMGLNAAQ